MGEYGAEVRAERDSSQVELLLPAREFDLEETLESGQCFRWWPVAARHYVGIVGRCVLQVRQEETVQRRLVRSSRNPSGGVKRPLRVRILGGEIPEDPAAFLIRYFDLARDYSAIVRRLRRDAVFARLTSGRTGIHILRQDPFEVIISFIISANNHIPRIRGIIERLCRRYGEEISISCGSAKSPHTAAERERRYYSFPRPEVLADARCEDLREHCGTGYRDRYVRDVARAIVEAADFASWGEWPTSELRRRLRELPGVGEKVAECILLFGFHRLEAFPVDTWIARAMSALYFPHRTPRAREIHACARERFGAYAGIAQQYLYAAFHSLGSVETPMRMGR